ncbi:reverse transcriptase domain-containing protein, partial [Tanacetum coccineum]
NQKADLLSKLALVAFNHLTKDILVETLDTPSMDIEEINTIVEEDRETWMTLVINYLERGIWLEDQNEQRPPGKDIIGQQCTGMQEKKYANVIRAKSQNSNDFDHGTLGIFQWGIDFLGPLPEALGKANGLVERANRSLMEGIKTRLGRERKGWVDELPNVLWAHRTLLKTSNGETPYSSHPSRNCQAHTLDNDDQRGGKAMRRR